MSNFTTQRTIPPTLAVFFYLQGISIGLTNNNSDPILLYPLPPDKANPPNFYPLKPVLNAPTIHFKRT